ncbi:hypothetical protein [Psychrobacter sp.]|uniref:hypothetical protein n=1 Tax=Psychrobacter sp. TaxID=56811 RepID=UPI0025D6123A|nr:hypothetical protein [Psychrobacter sp.]
MAIRQDNYLEGDINDIASHLYDELLTTGYSLLDTDVLSIVIDVCRDYIAWAGFLHAFTLDDTEDNLPLLIDGSTQLYNHEWSIMRPVVKARCDLMQAKRMEGAQNLGVQPVGITSSEAEQNYRDAMVLMKLEAFNTHPFSVDFIAPSSNQASPQSSIEFNYTTGRWP